MEHMDSLWVIFRIAGNQYAINSDYINGILMEPEQVTGVPDSEPYVRGIIKNRGQIITLLDVRTIFGQMGLDKDYDEFCLWMDELKQKHMDWVEALKHCSVKNQRFIVTKDSQIPGITYQAGRLKIDSVRVLLDKANEVCIRLKEEAISLEKALNQTVNQERSLQKTLDTSLQKADQYLRQILSFLDKAREAYLENCRRMMIVIKNNTHKREVGLIVDEIVGVNKLGLTFSNTTLENMNHSSLIRAVASSQEDDELILLLDENEIFHLGIAAEDEEEKSIAL